MQLGYRQLDHSTAANRQLIPRKEQRMANITKSGGHSCKQAASALIGSAGLVRQTRRAWASKEMCDNPGMGAARRRRLKRNLQTGEKLAQDKRQK